MTIKSTPLTASFKDDPDFKDVLGLSHQEHRQKESLELERKEALIRSLKSSMSNHPPYDPHAVPEVSFKKTQDELNQCLMNSIVAADLENVRFFLEHGANVNAKMKWHQDLPILVAIESIAHQNPTRILILHELIKAGAHINQGNMLYESPLHALLAHANWYGSSSSHCFCMKSLSQETDLFLSAGADFCSTAHQCDKKMGLKEKGSRSLLELSIQKLLVPVTLSMVSSAGVSVLMASEKQRESRVVATFCKAIQQHAYQLNSDLNKHRPQMSEIASMLTVLLEIGGAALNEVDFQLVPQNAGVFDDTPCLTAREWLRHHCPFPELAVVLEQWELKQTLQQEAVLQGAPKDPATKSRRSL